MPKENTENIAKSNKNFAPTFVDHYIIKNKISITKKVIILYIPYILDLQLRNLNTAFTLGSCLFGSVRVTKNADLDKYKYSSCSIGFHSRSQFLVTKGSYGRTVIIFVADMSSSVHIDDKRKDILILGELPTQGLDDITLIADLY